jgi:hypothetical protein
MKLAENSFETESEKKNYTRGWTAENECFQTLIFGRAECDCICVISSDFS